MHSQLAILLELQDLKAQKREIEEVADETTRAIERDVFQLRIDDAAANLQVKIEEMEQSLEPEVASRYMAIASRRPRAVVPVLESLCYGCFTAMPTSLSRDNENIRWCEHCGCFVYFVD